MPVRSVFRVGLLLALLLALAPALAQAQSTRTWVSGAGNDANLRTRTSPCATFGAAQTATQTDGEIDAVDSGGFNPLTVVKGLTGKAKKGRVTAQSQKAQTKITRRTMLSVTVGS